MERIKKSKLVHGASSKRTKTYKAWADMLFRCNNPTHKHYKHYGGRGIKVCERWQGERGFVNFLTDMGEAPKGMSLERENNNGNYEPGNCKWATQREQANNNRRNVLIWTGENYTTMARFAKAFGIPYHRFRYRYRTKGIPIEQILLEGNYLE